jgi:hypothetical protein
MIILNDARRLVFFTYQVGCPIRHRGQVSDDGSLHKSINYAEFLPFNFATGEIAEIHLKNAFIGPSSPHLR